jgi:hypothetical protein
MFMPQLMCYLPCDLIVTTNYVVFDVLKDIVLVRISAKLKEEI